MVVHNGKIMIKLTSYIFIILYFVAVPTIVENPTYVNRMLIDDKKRYYIVEQPVWQIIAIAVPLKLV